LTNQNETIVDLKKTIEELRDGKEKWQSKYNTLKEENRSLKEQLSALSKTEKKTPKVVPSKVPKKDAKLDLILQKLNRMSGVNQGIQNTIDIGTAIAIRLSEDSETIGRIESVVSNIDARELVFAPKSPVLSRAPIKEVKT